MMEFIFLLFYRAASGLQNGLGYAKNDYRMALTALLGLACAMSGLIFISNDISLFATILSVTLAAIALVAAILVDLSFRHSGKVFDIHFWELLTTGCITLAWVAAGGNILVILASVYPGLILHKGFVNILGGNAFFHVGTDDATGRTWSLPIIGKVIYRGGNTWRIFLTICSLALMVLSLFEGWEVRMFPFVIDLFGK